MITFRKSTSIVKPFGISYLTGQDIKKVFAMYAMANRTFQNLYQQCDFDMNMANLKDITAQGFIGAYVVYKNIRVLDEAKREIDKLLTAEEKKDACYDSIDFRIKACAFVSKDLLMNNSFMLSHLFVMPEYRQMGFATALINTISQEYKGRKLSMFVSENNKTARIFYNALGLLEHPVETIYDISMP